MSGWNGGRNIARIRAAVIDTYGCECSLCHELIDLSARWPDPRSFTIDHVLARKHGGSDALENLRPAHKECNERKGARFTGPGRQPWADRSFF